MNERKGVSSNTTKIIDYIKFLIDDCCDLKKTIISDGAKCFLESIENSMEQFENRCMRATHVIDAKVPLSGEKIEECLQNMYH